VDFNCWIYMFSQLNKKMICNYVLINMLKKYRTINIHGKTCRSLKLCKKLSIGRSTTCAELWGCMCATFIFQLTTNSFLFCWLTERVWSRVQRYGIHHRDKLWDYQNIFDRADHRGGENINEATQHQYHMSIHMIMS